MGLKAFTDSVMVTDVLDDLLATGTIALFQSCDSSNDHLIVGWVGGRSSWLADSLLLLNSLLFSRHACRRSSGTTSENLLSSLRDLGVEQLRMQNQCQRLFL